MLGLPATASVGAVATTHAAAIILCGCEMTGGLETAFIGDTLLNFFPP